MIPKRIILSRKGFDAEHGGRASPIFEDSTMVSIPIPEGQDSQLGPNLPVKYEIIVDHSGRSLGHLVESLTRGRVLGSHWAHLDPDLKEAAIPRSHVGWLPSLGHAGAPQSHLANNHVEMGDLFLFFGWLRRVTSEAGGWKYTAKEPDLHVLFGWLQIGALIPVGANPSATIARYPWIEYHPHLADSYARWPSYGNNTIYVARRWLSLPEIPENTLSGGGVFARLNPSLVLTAPGQHNRGLWLLPSSFRPRKNVHTMTYHTDQRRWQLCDTGYLLRTVGRGQEFILNTDDYPEIISWVRSLLQAPGNSY